MTSQFFGREFWVTLLALAGCFAWSALAYAVPELAAATLALVFAVVACVSWTRPDLGIAVAFAELFANAHGHLVSVEVAGFSVSLRMVVFAAVLSAWGAALVSGRARVSWRDARLLPFLPLVAAAAVGFAVGLTQNDPVKAFRDGNAYLYLGYLLPILSVEWSDARRRLLLQVFVASTAWVVALTLGLLYVFTHFPEWMLGPTYAFIRDTRTGELTKMSGAIFRVFLQSQWTVVAALYLAVPFLFVRSLDRRAWRRITLALVPLMAAVIISLSRSFWVGMIAGDVALLALAWADGWPGIRSASRAIASAVVSVTLGAILLAAIVLFPLPYRVGTVGDLASLVSDRTTDASDAAISSRWNLLPPLIEEIRSAPLLGSGFGEEVTFKTDDPRARAVNPDGTWTTYALEWGWLEQWLKMGLLGPVAMLVAFAGILRGLVPFLRSERGWIAVWLGSALVALYATHVFSPYLNHPLGLGFLLFCIPFLTKTPPFAGTGVRVFEWVGMIRTVQRSRAPSMSE